MPLDNCRQCGRIFQRTISPLCKSCYTFEQERHITMYRYIQENPGITMAALSEKFDIPMKELESLLFSGALGTANQLIVTNCSRCGCEMSFLNRVGYFCYSCNCFVEHEAAVAKSAIDPRSRVKALLLKNSPHLRQALQERKPHESTSGPQSPEPLPSSRAEKQDTGSGRELRYGFRRSTRRLNW